MVRNCRFKNDEKETMTQVVMEKKFSYRNLGDNVHYREKCSKKSIVSDNMRQHNSKDNEMYINEDWRELFHNQ